MLVINYLREIDSPNLKKAFMVSTAMIITWLLCIQQGSGYVSAGVMSAAMFMAEKNSGSRFNRVLSRSVATILGGATVLFIGEFALVDAFVFNTLVIVIVALFTFLAALNKGLNPYIAYVFAMAGLTVCFTGFPTTYNPSLISLWNNTLPRLMGMFVAIIVAEVVSGIFTRGKPNNEFAIKEQQQKNLIRQLMRKPLYMGDDKTQFFTKLSADAKALYLQYADIRTLAYLLSNKFDIKKQGYLYILQFIKQTNTLNNLLDSELSEQDKIKFNLYFSLMNKAQSVEKTITDLKREFTFSLKAQQHLEMFLDTASQIQKLENNQKPKEIFQTLNWKLAFKNSLRCFLTLMIISFFWFSSDWYKGANTMMLAGTLCVMFSALPIPGKAGSMLFFAGHFLCVIVAYILEFFIMPGVIHPSVLFAVVGVYLMITTYKMNTIKGPLSMIFFFMMLFWPAYTDLANIPGFNEESFINTAIANLLAALIFRFMFEVIKE
ncbi:FUSC family protein [Vibrio sp. SS-MA-C1-2]|uniref:FUSC family protein n=1 Tax=Vibrio sp. SS-MA-C1-2 TaxID=2908646 RepID=UPI001F26DCBD|nr:FUSC family protein [Vibrio sp. SS-MA-C1-2]UJF18723.1 FUSC family protein [Vibrio sp. SS-MA-C1-2]